jgi:hypothetical protein
MNIVGWYPLIRMCFNNSIFAVPDQPSSPAIAFATTTNGVVTGITVTNGGSGYWYLPNAGMGAGIYPNNPEQTGAAVVISTGYVVDLLYR